MWVAAIGRFNDRVSGLARGFSVLNIERETEALALCAQAAPDCVLLAARCSGVSAGRSGGDPAQHPPHAFRAHYRFVTAPNPGRSGGATEERG